MATDSDSVGQGGWEDYKPQGDEGWQDYAPAKADPVKQALASVPNPRQQLNMKEWGGTPSPTAGLPGSSPNPVAAGPGYTAAVGIPLAAAATVMGGGLPYVASAAKAIPTLAAMEGIRYARQNLPGGKYIPEGAEWLPVFMHGGEGKASPKPEAPAETPNPFRDVPDPSKDVFNVREPAPEMAAPPEAETPAPKPGYEPIHNSPHTLSGEGALRQVLTGQDNQALLKIAKSRGVNVTKEAQLKPGVADNQIIGKIIDSFSPDELDEVGAKYLENTRMGRSHLGDIGPEAWKTKSLQTYFPDLKLSKARLARTEKAVAGARKAPPMAAPGEKPEEGDLTKLLQESLKRAKKNGRAAGAAAND